jgi:hypothetical protein
MAETYTSLNNPNAYITCYIRNMITGETIEFVTLPEDINENVSASWATHEVMGRSAPYFNYSGNDARSVSYNVKLFKDALGDKFVTTVRQLQSLVYPRYSGALVIPPYCYVRFGKMVKMFAIVNSVSVNWDGTFIDGEPNSNTYSVADVGLDFSELISSGNRIPQAAANGMGLYEYEG